ncbi:MAG: UDP-N-acetylglucosamine 2-epimerase [Acidimicrobiales bacterium]|jgi:UDP-hydrolysing UDP-N-acetyl-D-glucosamine 2-epimerase|nr:UDP-N-acetylglucosamine 2-epimerase [Acidimicrobiales bacterium]
MTRKVCVVVTARPSYSRIKTALLALRARDDVELQLVVAASAMLDKYGLAVSQIQADGFEPSAEVFTLIEGENPTTMAKSTGLGLIELASVFDNLRPDVVVSIADRFETIATAIAAAYMNIAVAHVQGGEITGSIDEKVRHSVTKLSDLHLVSTRGAADNVVRMGEEPNSVHVTGCPSIDLAAEVAADPALDFEPLERYGGVGASLDLDEGYLVVMQHPVTSEHELARTHVLETLHAVNEFDLPVLLFWPNPDAGSDGTSNGIRTFRELEQPKKMHFFKNMAPHDFLRLLVNSRGIVGNSSVGIRECSYLGVPAVNIGSRQDKRERGRNVVDVDYDRGQIAAAIGRHLEHGPYASDPIYGDGRAGERIADVLATAELRTVKRLTY